MRLCYDLLFDVWVSLLILFPLSAYMMKVSPVHASKPVESMTSQVQKQLDDPFKEAGVYY